MKSQNNIFYGDKNELPYLRCYTYKEERTELAYHIGINLDNTCDFDCCTKRILSITNSEISLFTATHMIINSFNNNYYLKCFIRNRLPKFDFYLKNK